MASAPDVAAAVIERLGKIDSWKLQKLVYYCQAWHLSWCDEPLFAEPIEAWKDGPVCPELWRRHRGKYHVTAIEGAQSDRLNARHLATVNAVIERYGRLTGSELSALTHSEGPWVGARRGRPEGAPGDDEITHSAIVNFHRPAFRSGHQDELTAVAHEVAVSYDIEALVAEARQRQGSAQTSEELRRKAEAVLVR